MNSSTQAFALVRLLYILLGHMQKTLQKENAALISFAHLITWGGRDHRTICSLNLGNQIGKYPP